MGATENTSIPSPTETLECPVPESFSQGLQVEPAAIEKELKRLWKEGEGVVTRASLMNFAIYSEAADALQTNSALMAEITKNHSCRGILIAAHPSAENSKVTSWISAHCHVSGAAGRHVCCEQVAFLLEGKATRWIPNIVFSHLDSDLPLSLWWQGNLPLMIDKQLWNWVNNLLFDSQDWAEKSVQFSRLNEIQEKVSRNLVMSDLAWTRQIYLRLATAHFFDHPAGAAQLAGFKSLKITHHPDYLFSALLFAGWMAVQLGWRFDLQECTESRLIASSDHGVVEIIMHSQEGEMIAHVTGGLDGGESFEIDCTKGADYLKTTMHGGDGMDLAQAMPAGRHDPASLVVEELRRGGKHRIYSRTIRTLEPLMDKLGL